MCKHLEDKRITQEIEEDKEGFAINGCCGGGCFVITGIKFCPFCGKRLKK